MKKYKRIIGMLGFASSLALVLFGLRHLTRMAEFGFAVAEVTTQPAELAASKLPLEITDEISATQRENIAFRYVLADWDVSVNKAEWALMSGIVGLIIFGPLIPRGKATEDKNVVEQVEASDSAPLS